MGHSKIYGKNWHTIAFISIMIIYKQAFGFSLFMGSQEKLNKEYNLRAGDHWCTSHGKTKNIVSLCYAKLYIKEKSTADMQQLNRFQFLVQKEMNLLS